MSLVLPTFQGFSHTPTVAATPYELDATYSIDSTPSLHLDASILDGSDSANNPANGTSVATWGDRSGNNYDFTEATNQPIFRSSLLRGKAGVEFDGSNDILSDSDFFSNADFSAEEATMIVVGIPGRDGSGGFGVNTQDTYFQFVKTSNVTNSTDSFGTTDYSANFLSARLSAAALDSTYRQTPTSRPFINACKVGTNYQLFTNKRQRLSRSMTGLTFSTGSGISLGGVGTFSPLSGYICEVLLFNTVISDDDFNTIHDYLSDKYGLNIYSEISTSSYALDGSNSVSFAPQFHFDASQSNTVLNSSYSNVSDGNDVYYWKDKSNDWYAIQPTATRQPSFVSSRTIGGTSTTSSALYFDGTGESLELWYPQWFGDYTTANKSVVIIFEPDTDTAFELLGLGTINGSLMFGATTSYCGTFRAARLGGVGLSQLSGTNGQMVEIYSDATANTYNISSQGVSAISQTTTSWSVAALGSNKYVPQLGGSSLTPGDSGASYRFKGWMYEVLIFDNIVTSSDKTALVAYAQSKYGI
jgi:hypothetical protein